MSKSDGMTSNFFLTLAYNLTLTHNLTLILSIIAYVSASEKSIEKIIGN